MTAEKVLSRFKNMQSEEADYLVGRLVRIPDDPSVPAGVAACVNQVVRDLARFRISGERAEEESVIPSTRISIVTSVEAILSGSSKSKQVYYHQLYTSYLREKWVIPALEVEYLCATAFAIGKMELAAHCIDQLRTLRDVEVPGKLRKDLSEVWFPYELTEN